jgi:hypothetical protein
MSNDVVLDIRYNIKTGEFSYTEKTTVKPECRSDILENFLRSQMGAGQDLTDPEVRDEYAIKIVLDLSDDSFYVTHDCGNKGLRDGILMDVMTRTP